MECLAGLLKLGGFLQGLVGLVVPFAQVGLFGLALAVFSGRQLYEFSFRDVSGSRLGRCRIGCLTCLLVFDNRLLHGGKTLTMQKNSKFLALCELIHGFFRLQCFAFNAIFSLLAPESRG